MTVEQYFSTEKIDRTHLWAIQEESEYWEKASLFILDNWDSAFEGLSEKQQAWATRILEDLAEKRIEGFFG